MSSCDLTATLYKSALGSEPASDPGNQSCATSVFSTCAAAPRAIDTDILLVGEGVNAVLWG